MKLKSLIYLTTGSDGDARYKGKIEISGFEIDFTAIISGRNIFFDLPYGVSPVSDRQYKKLRRMIKDELAGIDRTVKAINEWKSSESKWIPLSNGNAKIQDRIGKANP
jgi:hypothetical protein